MKTTFSSIKPAEKAWVVIDAKDQVLGRVATKAAEMLRGKHKTDFSPNLDNGDNVIIINASQVRVTGNKASKKIYYKHSGFVGGLKDYSFEELMERNPLEVVQRAVKGMLSNSRLGRSQLRHLKVYSDEKHGHEAQKPTAVTV